MRTTTDHLPYPTLTSYNLHERGHGENRVIVRDYWSTCKTCYGPILRIDLFAGMDENGDEAGAMEGGMPWTHVHPSTATAELEPGR